MTILLTNRQERTRFFRFALVGIIGAVVDFGTMNLLVAIFSATLRFAGTVSFIVAVLSNFIWNRYWTYPDSRSKPILKQLVEFFVINAMGLVIRLPILILLEPLFLRLITIVNIQYPFVTAGFLAKNITLSVAVVIVMFWNFFANRYWTYSDVDHPRPA